MSDPLAGLDPATVLLHTLVSQLIMPHAIAHMEAQTAAANKMQQEAAQAAAAAMTAAVLMQQQQQYNAAANNNNNTNNNSNNNSNSSNKYTNNSSNSNNSRPPPGPNNNSGGGNSNNSGGSGSSNSGGSYGGSRPPCACKDCLSGKPPPPNSSSSNNNGGNSGSSNYNANNNNNNNNGGAPFGRSLSDAQSRYSNSDSGTSVTSMGVLKQMNQSSSPPQHGYSGNSNNNNSSNSSYSNSNYSTSSAPYSSSSYGSNNSYTTNSNNNSSSYSKSGNNNNSNYNNSNSSSSYGTNNAGSTYSNSSSGSYYTSGGTTSSYSGGSTSSSYYPPAAASSSSYSYGNSSNNTYGTGTGNSNSSYRSGSSSSYSGNNNTSNNNSNNNYSSNNNTSNSSYNSGPNNNYTTNSGSTSSYNSNNNSGGRSNSSGSGSSSTSSSYYSGSSSSYYPNRSGSTSSNSYSTNSGSYSNSSGSQYYSGSSSGSNSNSYYTNNGSNSGNSSGNYSYSSSNKPNYSNNGSSYYSSNSSLPPSLVQSTMVPAPSIGHINIEKLNEQNFSDGPTTSPLMFSASPPLGSADQPMPPSTLSPMHTPRMSALHGDAHPSGPPVFDAASAMIVMSTSPPLHSVGSPSLASHIPSLDSFPPSATASKSAMHRAVATPRSTSLSPRFQLHSPTATFNLPSPSLPPILTKNPLDLRAMSNSPLIGSRTLGGNTSSSAHTSHAQSQASSSHQSSSSTSLLLSTPSASYLRATPSSPSSLVFSSFLKSPIMTGGVPTAAGASSLKADSSMLGTSATSVTSAAVLLNGSDVARENKERETIISLKTIAAGAPNTANTPTSTGRDSTGATYAAGSISSGSNGPTANVATSSMSSTSMASPNLSILHRLKTINQSSSSPENSTSGAATTTASPEPINTTGSGSNRPPTTTSLQQNPPMNKRAPPSGSNNSGGNSSYNYSPAPIPPADFRKRPRDVYEGGGSAPISSSSSSDCSNCVHCQAIAAQKAAAAAAAAANAAPTGITPNPYPSTPFSSSTPHTGHSSHHSLLKSPLSTQLMPTFTPPIFPQSSLNLLVPSSNLLSSQPISSSRRNSLMALSPALRPITSSPTMGARGSSGGAGTASSTTTNAAGESTTTTGSSLTVPTSSPASGSVKEERVTPSPGSLLDGVLSTSSPMLLSMSASPQSLMCHQCAQHRPVNTLVFCCHAYAKKGVRAKQALCTNKYCESCILAHYTADKVGSKLGASITQFPPAGKRHDINHQWECPACVGVCSCAVCGSSPLLPLSEVNPLTLSPSHTLAYAYVFMSEYLEDSMESPPSDAQASEAAAAVGLVNAAAYAIATSPVIRPAKLENGERVAPPPRHSMLSINVCPVPPSMSALSDDEDDDVGVSRSTSTFHSDRKLVISKTSPELSGAIKKGDALDTILAASKSPMLQAVSDAMRTGESMPVVKLEGAHSGSLANNGGMPSKSTYLQQAYNAASSGLGSVFVPTLPIALAFAASPQPLPLTTQRTPTSSPMASSVVPTPLSSIQADVTTAASSLPVPPASAVSLQQDTPMDTTSDVPVPTNSSSTAMTDVTPSHLVGVSSGTLVVPTSVSAAAAASAASMRDDVAIAAAAVSVSGASSVGESPLLIAFASPQTAMAIAEVHRQLAAEDEDSVTSHPDHHELAANENASAHEPQRAPQLIV